MEGWCDASTEEVARRASGPVDSFGRGSACGPDMGLSVTGACNRVADQLGINRDMLLGWVRRGLTPDLGHAESRIGAGESEMIHNHGQEELLR